MIVVDANLLLYAYVSSYSQHDAARSWLEQQLAGTARVGLPWASLLAFVRIAINARIFPRPASIGGAWEQVERWLDADPAWVPTPQRTHQATLAACLHTPGLRANDVPDAHLAALAIDHGLRLGTADAGFARFDQLDWFNPLHR